MKNTLKVVESIKKRSPIFGIISERALLVA